MRNKVLLVEDDDLSCYMMEEMLHELGVQYEVARNGQECIDVLEDKPNEFSTVLMDIHMPIKTGLEALAEIRSAPNDPPKRVNVVAVTADLQWHDAKSAVAKGFDDVLPKPVSLHALEKILV